MSKSRKLELPMEELINIAKALNENTITNKSRATEDKISTDKFIRKFGIDRKSFSSTIKDTEIKYNRSTFLYDIPSETLVVESVTNKNLAINESNDSETFVSLGESALVQFHNRLKDIEDMRVELEEMMKWYKEQRQKENIIDIEIPQIHINKERINEEAITRGFKVYPSVVAEFKEFCKKNSQYTMQDLMAMAMIEYMDRY